MDFLVHLSSLSQPSSSPTAALSSSPTASPSGSPTAAPSSSPSSSPTASPTASPTVSPSCDIIKLKIKAPKKVQPGKLLKFDIAIGNKLKETVFNVDVIISLPSGVTFIESKNPFKSDNNMRLIGRDVMITLGKLRARQFSRLVLTVRVQSSTARGTLSFPVVVSAPSRNCVDRDVVQVRV